MACKEKGKNKTGKKKRPNKVDIKPSARDNFPFILEGNRTDCSGWPSIAPSSNKFILGGWGGELLNRNEVKLSEVIQVRLQSSYDEDIL